MPPIMGAGHNNAVAGDGLKVYADDADSFVHGSDIHSAAVE